jgi:tRNA(adenine34) deaminase
MVNPFSHGYFMKQALAEAEKAFQKGEIPVGAIITCNNQIVARCHNLTETLNDVTAHAEVQAITSASNYLGSKYLPTCTMYVTLEPCAMCAGALYWAQIGTLVYGAFDEKRGFTMLRRDILHPKTSVEHGVMEDECAALLKTFFAKIRGNE